MSTPEKQPFFIFGFDFDFDYSHLLMNSTSTSYDFIDLEEEGFTDFRNVFTFPPSNSPVLLPLGNATAVFIRSTSPPAKMEMEQQLQIKAKSDTCEFIIKINESQMATLKFNPRGQNNEGRDSKVFRGTWTTANLTIPVAVKVYKDEEDSLAGARKEVELVQMVQRQQRANPLLELYYAGQLEMESDCYVSIWDWIEGGTLDRTISRMKMENITFCIKSLANSIAVLHSARICHHDIKPQNIVITSDFSKLFVIDFGDSKHLPIGGSKELLPVEEGIGLGTLAYTAPELLSRKFEFYDPFASDVYSFGVLLFYLLNRGQILPFSALIPHRAVQVILAVQKGFFAGGYNPESPRDSPFYPLMLDCLKVDPLKRPKFPEILEIINKIEEVVN